MTPKTWYNENDPFTAQWLRNLISNNLITPGDVDERSILDITPDELAPYTRCHFFAGIAGWDLALQLADFPADREVWTGSCPCQPFSAAGRAGGFADERHLWPHWFHLIAQRRPATLFGEQVASKAGLEWFDLVWTDLEGADYAVGISDLGAACVGAPHIRQRLWFVANTDAGRCERADLPVRSARQDEAALVQRRFAPWLADANGGNASAEGIQRGRQHGQQAQDGRAGGVGHAGGTERNGRADARTLSRAAAASDRQRTQPSGRIESARASSPWDCDWLPCTDGKARPVEPGTLPLAHGIPGRVGRLRAYGNAIVPQVAAAFVEVAMEYAP